MLLFSLNFMGLCLGAFPSTHARVHFTICRIFRYVCVCVRELYVADMVHVDVFPSGLSLHPKHIHRCILPRYHNAASEHFGAFVAFGIRTEIYVETHPHTHGPYQFHLHIWYTFCSKTIIDWYWYYRWPRHSSLHIHLRAMAVLMLLLAIRPENTRRWCWWRRWRRWRIRLTHWIIRHLLEHRTNINNTV